MVIYSLYPSHTCMFVCIGTLIPELSLTLAIYFMRWNFLKHATKWRCHKRKKNNNTFDHLALGVHNIFISYFFHIFFSISLFIIFSCSYFTLAYNVGGKEDEFVLIETLNVQYMKRDDIIVKLCIYFVWSAELRTVLYCCRCFDTT